ncbi:MAG TPA: UDP-N-acetylmuramoyl-tripeptide--D-alanyl-D-alanine ligase [Anaerolineae bacterium]|nr:UDP-N-acetylmuramoyl-tripeptide--D-alanyl-D-alanine ligase [Anaerolineae bacterium]
MLTLADLVEGITGQRPTEGVVPQLELSEVVIDSREACPLSLFVALRGERRDGHDFVADAFARGAVAAIVDRKVDAECQVVDARSPLPRVPIRPPVCLMAEDSLKAFQRLAAFWRARFSPRVIGVTGSVGKTTTKEMIWSVLRKRFRTLKTRGSYNNEIGLPLTLLYLDSSHERVVLEMGMYALGEIAELAAIARPHVGVVTNVGPTHLERLGTIERIAQAKSELLEALPPASEGGVAVLNRDDPMVRAMAEKAKAEIFYYGLDPACDLWASHIESRGLEGVRFQLHHKGERLHVKIPLLGRHSVHTALAAAAVGLVEGVSWEEIIAGLWDVAEQLRLVAVRGIKGSTILDDTYNASPASTIAALNLLEELSGRKIAVLGDMLELGDFEEEGHRKVGRRAVDVVSILITVGPRGRIIGQEALACGMAEGEVLIVEDNEQASALMRQIVDQGDIVLVKGSRGMKMEEIVAALTAPLNQSQGIN